jgi:hypothetical protein
MQAFGFVLHNALDPKSCEAESFLGVLFAPEAVKSSLTMVCSFQLRSASGLGLAWPPLRLFVSLGEVSTILLANIGRTRFISALYSYSSFILLTRVNVRFMQYNR